ncbi:6-bladed beta-propeller [Paraflavitalea pollutisoli]|uniref:6-bladed beta-propeller n=1 Tax=Paraflavitalea pollutisoli TaxID=3034143 RepID=UPI0023ECF84F|nr:6-bladed beta-propeller [Paraflavitalea sp. H1-2-19X]
MRNSILLFVLGGLLASCDPNVQTGPIVDAKTATISVDNGAITDFSNIDTLISSFSYIPLETTDSSLLGNINAVFPIKNRIVVFDKYNAKSVFIFSDQGKFVAKLSPSGEGPGEFNSIGRCKADSAGIDIFDNSLSKMLHYDLDGQFSKEYKVAHFYKTNFLKYSEGKYLFYNVNEPTAGNEGYKLIAWDAARNQLERYFLPIDRSLSMTESYVDESHFQASPEGPVFFEFFNDTIYNFAADSLKLSARYILDFKDDPSPAGYVNDKNIRDKMKDVEKNQYAVFGCRYLELKDYLFFNYIYKKGNRSVIWDKKRKETFSNANFIVSSKTMLPCVNWYKGAADNQLLVKFEAAELIALYRQRVQEGATKALLSSLEHVTAALKEDDNPVLLVINLKG